jgi:hypothetical protein
MAMPPRKKKSPWEDVSTTQLVRKLKKSLKIKLRRAKAASPRVKNRKKRP